MVSQKKGKKTLYWGDKVSYHTRYCKKNHYDNCKSCPKFGMATSTIEIVIMQQSCSLTNMIDVQIMHILDSTLFEFVIGRLDPIKWLSFNFCISWLRILVCSPHPLSTQKNTIHYHHLPYDIPYSTGDVLRQLVEQDYTFLR